MEFWVGFSVYRSGTKRVNGRPNPTFVTLPLVLRSTQAARI